MIEFFEGFGFIVATWILYVLITFTLGVLLYMWLFREEDRPDKLYTTDATIIDFFCVWTIVQYLSASVVILWFYMDKMR